CGDRRAHARVARNTRKWPVRRGARLPSDHGAAEFAEARDPAAAQRGVRRCPHGRLPELETLGLLTHPHTSAGRTPTESGYRVYAEELVDTLDGRPDALGVDLRSMRDEIEQALRVTTDMLSDATRLLALVSAPSLQTASI